MWLDYPILESILVYMLLVFYKTDAKASHHKSRTKHRSKIIEKDPTTRELSLNKLRGSKINRTESGDRRQFMTGNNVSLQSQVVSEQTIPTQESSHSQETMSNPTSLSPEADATDATSLPSQQLIAPTGTPPVINLNRLANDTNPLIEGGLTAPNLPMLNNSLVPNGIESEKPLPISYDKPEIRLVPKLVNLPYSRKPDVHVSHVHLEQGGECRQFLSSGQF